MDSLSMTRAALVAFLLLFILVAVVFPTIRLKRRAGLTGYVAHQAPTPVHRIAVEGLRGVVFGLLSWTTLFIVREPSSLGIWRLPPWLHGLGWVLLALGVLVVVVAQTQMGLSWRVGIDTHQRTELVTHGLFKAVRNPIFTGMLASSLGIALLTLSPWTVMGWLFFAYVLAFQVRLEEEHLSRLHGDSYQRYAGRVGRFLPGVGVLRPTRPEGVAHV